MVFVNLIQCLVGFLLINTSLAQFTNDCGQEYGCLRVPVGCHNSHCQYIVKWKDTSPSTTTFIIMAYQNITAVFNSWAAIGLSNDIFMGSDSVMMCIPRLNKVDTYYNAVHMSNLLLNTNPTIGISNAQVEIFNRYLVCRFDRQKSFRSINGYYNLTSPNRYHILVASGPTDAQGKPIYHGSTRYVSPYRQDFSSLLTAGPVDVTTSTTNPTAIAAITVPTTTANTTLRNQYHKATSVKKKAHSCIMIFAWIFFVSIGILLPRYHKYLFGRAHVCGSRVWLVLHIPIMITAAVFNLVAFLVILSEQDWKWISILKPVEFTHSIFGIIAMSLLYIQFFIGLFKPKKDSRFRKCYRYFHGSVGYAAFFSSIIAMFLGTIITDMNLDRIGWCIMLGWTFWIIVLPMIHEILKLTRLGENNRNTAYKLSGTLRENYEKLDQYKRIFHGIKSFLLVVHVLVALGIALSLVIVIGLSNDYYW